MVDGAVCGIRPWVGLRATRPQCPAGSRTDPAISLPTAPNPIPAASAAPAPELDPPVLRVRFHGLRVMPYSELDAGGHHAEVGHGGLTEDDGPRFFEPGGGRRVDAGVGQVRVGGTAVPPRHPDRVHAVLDGDGHTVQRASSALPSAQRRADACAAARAPAVSRWAIALTAGLRASMRASVRSRTSTGGQAPLR